ncbi:M2 family metallopeptidase [Nannocystis bainbridge]|uniref:M2 family metallopeptidase n=1 Tax=Nannocystis bainbridge TaxID=2995303 RepID=A0ABT5EBS2_9BACT|nr:M2 family metallopeptidase [Nannocystis bainbridge]MDC0722312.1 M2 family metallopeptidase [Nannocystis bainbridge]
MLRPRVAAFLVLPLLPVIACQGGAEQQQPAAQKGKPARVVDRKGDGKAETKLEGKEVEKAPGQAAEARAFVERVDGELRALAVASSKAEWDKNTNITDATEKAAADANEKLMEFMARTIKEATTFTGGDIDPETARKLHLLKVTASPPPAPGDPDKRKRLAELGAKMEGIYGKGKACEGAKCKDLGALEDIIGTSRKYDELLKAWTGWHKIAVELRPLYQEFVGLANEGAKEIGYKDLGELWRAGYDMSPADFEQETERLWTQVQPLYDKLHCYVRGKLADKYGKDKVPAEGLIPAHLLGNMWAQEWANIYPLVEPFPGAASLDVTGALKKAKYDEVKLVKLGESFFTSVGLDPLPATFWERSMLQKPKDREVVCHASAWDVDFNDDLRIKMCIKINQEDLVTVHHELGHNYYYHYYYKLPLLFQNGAHDGFHEAIGDAIALSITPAYLKQIGLIDAVPADDKGLINLQMQDALEKIAFLPFGKLIDQWRWDVFSGKTAPEQYNEAWWALRAKYQGIAPPEGRPDPEFFDAGAKYHIPANVPYTRYFLARILQFQFHKALCEAAGHTGPLHECSIYGKTAAGDKLKAMLALGSSKPWPEAMAALTGTKQMDAGAMIEYFAPLEKWLDEQNQGKKCGW